MRPSRLWNKWVVRRDPARHSRVVSARDLEFTDGPKEQLKTRLSKPAAGLDSIAHIGLTHKTVGIDSRLVGWPPLCMSKYYLYW